MDALLRAYDEQLRCAAEMAGAERVERVGPLWLGWYDDGTRGFLSYRDLVGVAAADPADPSAGLTRLADLAREALDRFRDDAAVEEVEWKTRGHDRPPEPAELDRLLRAAGLSPEPVETVMAGEAAAVAAAGPEALPAGVELLRVEGPETERWITRAALMQRQVFGGGPSPAQALARHRERGEDSEFWVAHVGDEVVCAGRLEVVPETDFAGLWGGATRPDWRGRGIYRALASARARSAVERGVRYMQSDCTEMSRPILARAGLRAITTSTPYVWTRS